MTATYRVTENFDPTGVSGLYLESARFKPWQGPDFPDLSFT